MKTFSPNVCVGAVVRMKSGGPAMTVCHLRGDPGSVVCAWFDGDRLVEAVFHSNMLEVVDGHEAAA